MVFSRTGYQLRSLKVFKSPLVKRNCKPSCNIFKVFLDNKTVEFIDLRSAFYDPVDRPNIPSDLNNFSVPTVWILEKHIYSTIFKSNHDVDSHN